MVTAKQIQALTRARMEGTLPAVMPAPQQPKRKRGRQGDRGRLTNPIAAAGDSDSRVSFSRDTKLPEMRPPPGSPSRSLSSVSSVASMPNRPSLSRSSRGSSKGQLGSQVSMMDVNEDGTKSLIRADLGEPMSNRQALKHYIKLPIAPIKWPNTKDERMDVMEQLQLALQNLHRHLRIRGQTIKDVMPHKTDALGRPVFEGVDKNGNATVDSLFLGLRSIRKPHSRTGHKRKPRHQQARSAPVASVDQEVVDALIEFLDQDGSGEIECGELTNAFRLANRLFLLEDSTAPLVWEQRGQAERAAVEKRKKERKQLQGGAASHVTTTALDALSGYGTKEFAHHFNSGDGPAQNAATVMSANESILSSMNNEAARTLSEELASLPTSGSGEYTLNTTYYSCGATGEARRHADLMPQANWQDTVALWRFLIRQACTTRQHVQKRVLDYDNLTHAIASLRQIGFRHKRRSRDGSAGSTAAVTAAAGCTEAGPDHTDSFEEIDSLADSAVVARPPPNSSSTVISTVSGGSHTEFDFVRLDGDLTKPVDPQQLLALAKTLLGVEDFLRHLSLQTLTDACRKIHRDGEHLMHHWLSMDDFCQLHANLWDHSSVRLRALTGIVQDKSRRLQQKIKQVTNHYETLKGQERFLENSGVAPMIRRLQRMMRSKGMRFHELFEIMDKSGDGLVDRDELRSALNEIIKPGIDTAQQLATKRRLQAMQERRETELLRQARDEEMLDRMKALEETGAAQALFKLESFMRRYQLTAKDLFRITDKDNSNAIDPGELAHTLNQANANISLHQINAIFENLGLDPDTDTMTCLELQESIDEFRVFKRAKKFLKRVKERSSHPDQLLPDRQIVLLIRYIMPINGDGMTIDLSHLQSVVDKSKTMPMSKLFREYRARKFPDIQEGLQMIAAEFEERERFYASYVDKAPTAKAAAMPEHVQEETSTSDLQVASKLRDLLDSHKEKDSSDVRSGLAGVAGKLALDKRALRLNESTSATSAFKALTSAVRSGALVK